MDQSKKPKNNRSGSDFLQLVINRQSNRAYFDSPVEKDKLFRCLEAARLAPSACNSQPWTFIVVDEKELKNKIADATSNHLLPLNHFTKKAPVHVVIVQESPNITSSIGGAIKDKDYTLMDIGIAAEHFCLQASTEGLGSCMIGWFNEKKVKSLLGIPNNKRPLLIITLGYPADSSRIKKRKSIEKITRFNNYSSKERDA
jgi:nitroreductase